MVFVLDNYDSFTYNLVQYLGELGADVVVRRNDELTVEEVEATFDAIFGGFGCVAGLRLWPREVFA